MARSLLSIVVILLFAAPAPASVGKLQKALNDTQRFQTTFDQTIFSSRFGDEHARGQVTIEKPNKMRWLYFVPKGRLFLADGTTLYRYDPQDGVEKSNQQKLEDSSSLLFFLWKDTDLTKHFTIKEKQKKNRSVFTLTPKDPQADLSLIVLEASFAPFTLHSVETTDALGQRNYLKFSEMKRNIKLEPNTFDFEKIKKTIKGTS